LQTFASGRTKALEDVVLKTVESEYVGLTVDNAAASSAPVRRAVILAAGMGSRMGSLTTSVPKCLVEVNGIPILFRSLRVLASAGVTEVVVVVGYEADQVRRRVGSNFAGIDVKYVDAPLFDQTNNICSLWDARRYLDEDILLIEGDVVFDLDVVMGLREHAGCSMAVAADRAELSGTVVRHDDRGVVTSFILGAGRAGLIDIKSVRKTVNLYLLRGEALRTTIVPELCRQVESGNVQAYYESVFRDLVAARALRDLTAVDVSTSRWYEIDDHRDLELAEFMFLSPDQQFDRVQSLHGSYWRFGIVDHSYLYNMYFPPPAMLDQLHAELPELVTNYPVGQAEFDRLVAQWVEAPPENVVVGNGAAELIRILAEHVVDKMTIAVPSFNEYENTLRPDQLDRVPLDAESFDVDLDVFAESARRAGSNVAILVSPNNPTARSVSREDILELDDRLSSHGCRLIVDESFIEFSRAGRSASVEGDVESRPNLAVMKSMSKVFGIAGLRLGYLLTADQEFATAVRSHLPIWNMNGFAESCLRHLGRYRLDFEACCELVRDTCQDFYHDLLRVPGLAPLQPDANFVFCKISTAGLTGPTVARRLYVEHGILIKDCASKSMAEADRYLRIASRTRDENRRLVDALFQMRLDRP
jgi:histidinol-phosphate/aromatic aminotransferase/cobyric acid decarboxylase-like protein/NDP-sugar pyrophosphorylase family protein